VFMLLVTTAITSGLQKQEENFLHVFQYGSSGDAFANQQPTANTPVLSRNRRSAERLPDPDSSSRRGVFSRRYLRHNRPNSVALW
ncbi:hypothetical protein SK128_003263, partial [Halocaridina rubra]